MSISSIGSGPYIPTDVATGKLAALEAAAAKLDTQIASIGGDKSLDAKAKAAQLAALQAQKAQLEAQLAALSSQEKDKVKKQTQEVPRVDGFHVVA